MLDFNEAKSRLAEYGQEHLLKFYNELGPDEQASLPSEQLPLKTSQQTVIPTEKQVSRRYRQARLLPFFLQEVREHVSASTSRRVCSI